jgi:2',3'-cyclic-nucleotide 2'-phosphodiesterase (5'-nucleotidase family)
MGASLRWFLAVWLFAAGMVANVCVYAAQEVRITILQTTDLHHHANGADHIGLDVDPVSGTSVIGAYARIAAYVNYVRSSARNPVLLVDSGDWTMGTLYDLTLGTQPLALYFLDLMRYDCVTLGNHEFDYGPGGLAQMLATAQASFGFNTPIVASNMNLNGNAALEAFVGPDKAIQATRIQELENGLKVAYIGLMGRGAALGAPFSAPVTFTDPATQYAAIQTLIDTLRKRGASTSSSRCHTPEPIPPAPAAKTWSSRVTSPVST